ncbi:hypothetical protein FJ420_31170 [Mesorhizobium sp. B3-1-3]|uniref:hypothetical protein n=1 Tax=unclassified Mesorhizobium TaxID=325217 RepID=UPI00112E0820|nr:MULTISPECIES: hypothetical protein [unclassified Mesorhizobium]TPI60718.1 hypothetical protein FJ420_31170 [Mesorhizobium sp. B3-1-3]TPI71587.1 hypothetical protein FJ424_01815 [Mesorhizobium sp. B3-1-8]
MAGDRGFASISLKIPFARSPDAAFALAGDQIDGYGPPGFRNVTPIETNFAKMASGRTLGEE